MQVKSSNQSLRDVRPFQDFINAIDFHESEKAGYCLCLLNVAIKKTVMVHTEISMLTREQRLSSMCECRDFWVAAVDLKQWNFDNCTW